jgi:hypothetical protein
VTVIPDPTIRFAGTGSFSSGWIKLKAGRHQVDYKWQMGPNSHRVFEVLGSRIIYPDGVHPGRLTFYVVPPQFTNTDGGSGTSSITFATDVSIEVGVGVDADTTWTLAIH